MARRTRGAKALAFLDFFQTHAEILCEHFDCETLGRFALGSHRTYAMNEAGPLRARWLAAADALDVAFPLLDDLEYDPEKDAEQYYKVTGDDPRYDYMIEAYRAKYVPMTEELIAEKLRKYPWQSRENCLEFIIVSEAMWEAGVAAWRDVDPMQRVSDMVSWQSVVCHEVRACPEYFVKVYNLVKRDVRFRGYYDFEGFPELNALVTGDDPSYYGAMNDTHRGSPAMLLVLRLCYIKCCELSRCDSYSQANEVFLEGWECSDWSSSSRRDMFWLTLCDEDDEESPVITMDAVKHFTTADDRGVLALAPFLGSRATRGLQICRGAEDIPEGVEALFDAPFPY